MFRTLFGTLITKLHGGSERLGQVKSVVFASLFCLTGWYWLTPASSSIPASRKDAANAAIKLMLEDIRANRGDAKRAALFHFDNDPTDYVSSNLRKEILSTGILDLEEISLPNRVRSKLNLRIPVYASLEEVVAAPVNKTTDLLIWGQLTAFELNADNTAVISGDWYIINAKTKQTIFKGTISTSRENTTTDMQQNTASSVSSSAINLFYNILVFTLFALLIPIITFPLLRSTAAKRSNQANAIVIALYGTIGGILAFLMVGCSFARTSTTILFFIAFIANIIYDLAMLSFATRLEQ